MHTTKHSQANSPLPDYEPLFNENADEVRKKPVKILVRILGANWFKILISCFLNIVKALGIWLLPIITANIIDAVTNPTEDVYKIIAINAVLLFVVFIQNVPTHTLYAKYTDTMLRNIGAGLRNTMVRKLQQLSITYYKEIESGRVQSKFLRDIEAIEFFNAHFVKTVLIALINIIISVCITLSKSGEVTIFYALIVPVNVLLVNFFRKKMRANNFMFRQENETMSANLTTMIEMIPVTKAHGLENEEIARLEANIKKLKEKGFIVDRTNAYFGSIVWVVGQIMSGVCLVFSALLALKGMISVGDIVVFQSYFNNISGNVQSIVNIYPELAKGLESVRSVSEIVLSDNIEDNRDKIPLRYVHGSLSFENVSYRYPGADKDTIKDFTLEVNPGECIAFVGSSGSGKSTIMNMIIGFLKPTSGVFKIDGKPIEELSLPTYRHHISVVPQNSILFKGSIRDNITYGLVGITEEQIQDVIDKANIREFLPLLSNGIDTIVGEHGDKLSGGQKQRISIARALIRDPSILILDEATSALDNISEHHVQKAISSLLKDRTTFIVAHRLSTIRDADRIVVMDEGKIVEIGTYDELMEKKGHFYELKQLSDIK
ncbi:MAG: ABC transporter ATP-binding protein [Eubacteriales bacterium]|nr:ABC transporter ATP-binding protein [Eubacteriales bacterium]